ncbi:hypothetical protein BDR03DRAFT_909219 [Suillus americanus]|nr:hypothetical protein BDR03DRAFT_909219 [Suillus americanus]
MYVYTFHTLTSLLFQHLHRKAKADTVRCNQCNEEHETVHHFLFTCAAYNRQRHILRLELGTKAHHVKHGLNEEECLKPLFKYIASTRRFESTFGDVSLPKEKRKA